MLGFGLFFSDGNQAPRVPLFSCPPLLHWKPMTALSLWFLLICHGVTLIVTESKIAGPLRRGGEWVSTDLGTLLHCPMCMGFWVGVFLSIAASVSPSCALLGIGAPWGHLLDGVASSAVCWGVRVVEHAAGSDSL